MSKIGTLPSSGVKGSDIMLILALDDIGALLRGEHVVVTMDSGFNVRLLASQDDIEFRDRLNGPSKR